LAETHLLKLQSLQNSIPHTIGSFPRHTSVRKMPMDFHIPYVYDYITILCGQQVKVIQNNGNENVRNTGQGEA
jgi:hypothetical protein